MDSTISNLAELDPENAVVGQFRRTRRNRFILASAASLCGLALSFASDALGGAGTTFSIAVILILCYAYYRIFKSEQREEQNAESFPAVANDLQLLRENKKLAEVAGYRVMPDGWLIKNTLLTFDFFRPSEICWVYPTRSKHYWNFVPIYTSHGLAVGLKSGRTLRSKYGEEEVRDKLKLLYGIAPWAIFGYSEKRESVWRSSREAFVTEVETRCRAMGG